MEGGWGVKLSIALTAVLAGAALGAPPKFTPPAEVVPVGGYASIDVEDAGVASVTYVGLDGEDPLPALMLKDPRDFVLPTRGLAAGRYRYAAVASSRTGEQTRADFVVVVGTPPKPDPKPDPPRPDPSPGPDPKEPAAWVVVVEESERRTEATIKILNDLKYWESVKARGIGWRLYDDDQPEAAKFLPFVKAVGEPAVLILDKTGAVIHIAALPADAAGIDALLTRAASTPVCPDGTCPLVPRR